MTVLNRIIKTTPTAPRITIYGKPGIGKSTLANQFPKPLFLLTEHSELLDIDAIGPIQTFGEMWSTVRDLLTVEDLPYETIVIDSISKLDSLIIQYILDNEPTNKSGGRASTLAAACGGYGAGYARAQLIHRGLKNLFDKFKDKDIAVIYIAHVCTGTIKPPDAEDYSIHTITMNHDKSREIYIDDADAVLFCKMKSYVVESESGRNMVKSTGDRVIVTGISDSHVSKNRYKMPEEIDMSYEEIAKYIPFYKDRNEAK